MFSARKRSSARWGSVSVSFVACIFGGAVFDLVSRDLCVNVMIAGMRMEYGIDDLFYYICLSFTARSRVSSCCSFSLCLKFFEDKSK